MENRVNQSKKLKIIPGERFDYSNGMQTKSAFGNALLQGCTSSTGITVTDSHPTPPPLSSSAQGTVKKVKHQLSENAEGPPKVKMECVALPGWPSKHPVTNPLGVNGSQIPKRSCGTIVIPFEPIPIVAVPAPAVSCIPPSNAPLLKKQQPQSRATKRKQTTAAAAAGLNNCANMAIDPVRQERVAEEAAQQPVKRAANRNRNYRIPIPDPEQGTINIGEDLDYDFLMTRIYPYVSCFPATKKLIIYEKLIQLVYKEYMREKRLFDAIASVH